MTAGAPIAAACDGACQGNPGPGGWGWLIRLADGRRLEGSGSEAATTNNRMELVAAAGLLEALAQLPQPADLLEARTDSRYVIEGLAQYLPRWRRNGWRKADGSAVKNRDLWERLDAAAAAVPWVRLAWVKGHNGDPDNEAADRLATAAADRVAKASPAAAPAPAAPAAAPLALLPQHLAELQASAIPADLAAANACSFGAGTLRHWESERAELLRHGRRRIQTESRTASGHPQTQAGHLAAALIRLDARYRHLRAGGWRSLSDTLPGLEPFDQWKPDAPRERHDKPGRALKYESAPSFPDGGGLLLPRVPEPYWRRICERQDLPFPDPATLARGFWPWAMATPALQLLICEGWKKALSAVAAGWAAVALPGVSMGRRVDPDGSERLIEALQLLAPRPWLIVFDAEARPSTAGKVRGAAAALARALRAAGGRPQIARLPLLPNTDKTGLDDLLASAGPEALDRALADTGPAPVLPRLRQADTTAPAGQFLGQSAPIPSDAPLVVIEAPVGCGKTEAVSAHAAPLQAAGVPVLLTTHRSSLGRAAAERLGVPWRPRPGSDDRQTGAAACLDSWCPGSALRIGPTAADRGLLVLDEWMQQLEHLLSSTGTALGDDRRAAVLRTLAQQLPRTRQIVAMDAQLADWGVALLEDLTGRRAHLIRSAHQPMAGRRLHCPAGFSCPIAASRSFRQRWHQLVTDGRPFLCWVSAQQQSKSCNAAATLAELHQRWRPDLVDVVSSATPELAAELAADPDGFAERRMAEAERRGVSWALYVTPAISSGISWARWRPAAVIAYSGGRLAPEHVAQAVGRVRCPSVPVWIFTPERSPGSDLWVGSGATDPAELLRHLQAATDPLLQRNRQTLEASAPDGAYLQAWAQLGATRNRQRFAYRATVAGLLQREGWALDDTTEPLDQELAQTLGELLGEIRDRETEADADAIQAAAPISTSEADTLRRRRLAHGSREWAQLRRHRIAARWGLDSDATPSAGLIEADGDGLRERLRLGWLLTTPEALALVPDHDRAATEALDPHGQAFTPDRLRVARAPAAAAMVALQLPQLLARFAAGETIAATDPAVVALHNNATACRLQLTATAGVSPGARPSGTLRALLEAVGWKLTSAGRSKARGPDRDAYLYRAEREAMPKGVNPLALAAAWLAELGPEPGAKTAPIEVSYREKKSPSQTPPPSDLWPRVQAAAVKIPWPSSPPPCRGAGRGVAR